MSHHHPILWLLHSCSRRCRRTIPGTSSVPSTSALSFSVAAPWRSPSAVPREQGGSGKLCGSVLFSRLFTHTTLRMGRGLWNCWFMNVFVICGLFKWEFTLTQGWFTFLGCSSQTDLSPVPQTSRDLGKNEYYWISCEALELALSTEAFKSLTEKGKMARVCAKDDFSPTSYPVIFLKFTSLCIFAKSLFGDHWKMSESLWHARVLSWVWAWIGNRG